MLVLPEEAEFLLVGLSRPHRDDIDEAAAAAAAAAAALDDNGGREDDDEPDVCIEILLV